MLICGAAKRDINPDLPVHLAGYRSDLIATGIHDDLHIAALFLQAGDAQLAVLTFDTISMTAPFIEALQKACATATGLPSRAILTTVSHTHSGPRIQYNPTTPNALMPNERTYPERVIARSIEALQDAIQSAEPVTVHYNTGRIRENINRRVFFPDGQYYYLPKQKNLLDVADGVVDDELAVIYFKCTERDGYVATLVNYTAHPLTIGDSSSLVSADYPGVLKREIEANLGGTALFINGACGDNHPLGAEAGLSRCEQLGLALAQKALYHRWDAVMLTEPTIASDYREVVVPALSKAEFDALPQNFAASHRAIDPDALANIQTWVSLWALGPLLFVGVPGELTAELGIRLKWESPFAKLFVMYMATDSLGYIAHPNAFAWGGYEVLTSRVGPQAGATLCAEILQGAAALKAQLQRANAVLTLPGQGAGPIPENNPGAAKT